MRFDHQLTQSRSPRGNSIILHVESIISIVRSTETPLEEAVCAELEFQLQRFFDCFVECAQTEQTTFHIVTGIIPQKYQ